MSLQFTSVTADTASHLEHNFSGPTIRDSMSNQSRKPGDRNQDEPLGGWAGAVSRTYQYRKVMKPLLERKRRARINRCLEELKHLIKDISYMDADALAKLEKADILELTVHHLQDRQRPAAGAGANKTQHQRLAMERYWSGFRQCALEVSRFLQRHDRQLNAELLEAMKSFLPPQPLPPLWRPW